MQNNDNQSNTNFIYSRSLKKKIPCTEKQFQDFYREADRVWHKEHYHERCLCPYERKWVCDGDCEICKHHIGYGELSLDAPNTEDGKTLADTIEDEVTPRFEDIAEDSLLLNQLIARLCELDPDGATIVQIWQDHPEGISDRAVAKLLGRPQRTFADQMKKYRTELRKVRGY